MLIGWKREAGWKPHGIHFTKLTKILSITHIQNLNLQQNTWTVTLYLMPLFLRSVLNVSYSPKLQVLGSLKWKREQGKPDISNWESLPSKNRAWS